MLKATHAQKMGKVRKDFRTARMPRSNSCPADPATQSTSSRCESCISGPSWQKNISRKGHEREKTLRPDYLESYTAAGGGRGAGAEGPWLANAGGGNGAGAEGPRMAKAGGGNGAGAEGPWLANAGGGSGAGAEGPWLANAGGG